MSPALAPPVPVYAGDSTPFVTIHLFDDVAETIPTNLVAAGWSGWAASWRSSRSAATAIVLVVDVSGANVGVVTVSATAANTRAMGRSGVWDLEASRPGETRTFLMGTTEYTADVTHA